MVCVAWRNRCRSARPDRRRRSTRHTDNKERRLPSLWNKAVVSPCTSFILDETTVHIRLREIDTLELEQPEILLDTPIEWEPNRPGTGEYFRVRDRRLVLEMVGAHWRIALLHPECGAVVVPGTIEP